MNLTDFIQSEAAKRFDLGCESCAHFIARWTLLRTGKDGLAIFNGLNRETAEDLLAHRRLLRAVFEGCRSIGLERSREPSEGDIGVIRVHGRHRCAIRTVRGWIYRDEEGLGSARAEDCHLLMAWRT